MSKRTDRPTQVERFGIEFIPEEERHGSPRRVFTLWFAANLTIADYVIGVLCTNVFGLSVLEAIPVLLFGNVLGGLFLGLSAAMGPSLGFPQMFSSRASFGRRGNYFMGGLNWISTVGWFTVNTILGSEAVQALLPSSNFVADAAVLVALQVLLAVYGHDLIHLFEKAMSAVLGVLFLWLFVLTLPHMGDALSFSPHPPGVGASIGALGTVLAVSFSYIMSWSPYASDYSRYLPSSTRRSRVALLALAGGAAASFGVELVGALIGSLTRSLDYFTALGAFASPFGGLAILAVILGAVAANALNIYTNALSALVLDIRSRRWKMVVLGGIVGLALAVLGGRNFEPFYENFLLGLDYWITPWLAIVLVDFYLARRTTVERCMNARSWEGGALAVYSLSLAASVPFMVPALNLGFPFGSLSWIFGGADFSYFVSFAIASLLELVRAGRRADTVHR